MHLLTCFIHIIFACMSTPTQFAKRWKRLPAAAIKNHKRAPEKIAAMPRRQPVIAQLAATQRVHCHLRSQKQYPPQII
jgi:hypothetical protein